jgi:hypothetical protein
VEDEARDAVIKDLATLQEGQSGQVMVWPGTFSSRS